MQDVNQDNFEEVVIASKVPVLVDFYSPHCPPCTKMVPILEDLSKKYAGQINIVKVNVDEQGDIADRFGIEQMPTMLLFNAGEPVGQVIGAHPREAIQSDLDMVL